MPGPATCPCPMQLGGHDPLTRLAKATIFRTRQRRVVPGALWNVPVWPGSACSQALPASTLCEVTCPAKNDATLWSLYTVQQCAEGALGSLAWWAGQGQGSRPPSQERPASSGGPQLGRSPSQCGPEPRSPAPSRPTWTPACAGGSDAEMTARTPQAMHVCFLFFRKKSPFPVFRLFFFFRVFLFPQTLDLAHGEPSEGDRVS